ncbi:MAG: ATP phosphoribosyltransferase [Nitrospira sp.]|nr:ATP phosphoribosyltransferase [Candidatus Manganitrophaceae bacterium]HIL34673.1 ATP phosphoribosyltransferase [Candidatus Manganitrophaceae bacterium]
MEEMLVIALPKGRLLDPSIHLLKGLGILPKGLTESSRRLIHDAEKKGVRVLLVRAVDVATYVEYGAADMGIAGKDLLLEQMRDVYEPVDLVYGSCKVVLAQPEPKEKGLASAQVEKASHQTKLRIATKYPNITERYFSEKGMPIEIVKLYGSIELAPLVGLADQIVDLSSSGETLRAHNLTVVEELVQCSARLIVNRASLRLKYPRIQNMIDSIKKAVKS